MKHFKCIASAAAIVVASTTSGCSSSGICEDIVEVNRQEQVCQQLAKTMNDSRHPQQALTARKRHESECLELRYYRDDYDTICKGNETAIGESSTPPPKN